MKSIEQRTMQCHLEWVLWERTFNLGNSTAVEGGEEPSDLDTTRRRRTARAASGSHVGGGKERESTSSCETLHKLWTRLLNNAWGGLVSARPTMPIAEFHKLRIKITQDAVAEFSD